MSLPVAFEDVQRAADRVRPYVHRTPVLTSRSFDEQAGFRCFFKCENFQRGGSFKLRGASNFVFSLSPEERARGLVAYSSGNHAQAVAIAARLAGTHATLVMPADAPRGKLEATAAQGAKIVTYDRHRQSREAIGRQIAQETGAILVPPYDHPWTIAGQGTVALELLEQVPEVDALLVPVGGGGLISGCAVAARGLKPSIRVYGVEPELADDTRRSLRERRRVKIPIPETIADGLRATCPGEITFPIIQALVDDVLVVSEEEIRQTMRFLLTRLKIVVEPSGAVAAAAALFRKVPAGVRTAGIVISGGNVDLELLGKLAT